MRRNVFVIERNCLAELVLPGRCRRGITALQKTERGVVARAVRVDRQGLLDLRESVSAVSVGYRNVRQESVGVAIVRVDGQHSFSLLLGPGRLFACNQHVTEIDARLEIIGLKIDSMQQL